MSCVVQVACRTRETFAHDPLCEAHLVVCPEPVKVPQRDVVRGGDALRCHGRIPEVLDDVFDDSLIKRLFHRIVSPCAGVTDAGDGRARQEHGGVTYERSGVGQFHVADALAHACHMPVKQRVYRAVQELGPSPANHVRPDLKLREGGLERRSRGIGACLGGHAWLRQVGDVDSAVAALPCLVTSDKCVSAALLISEAYHLSLGREFVTRKARSDKRTSRSAIHNWPAQT